MPNAECPGKKNNHKKKHIYGIMEILIRTFSICNIIPNCFCTLLSNCRTTPTIVPLSLAVVIRNRKIVFYSRFEPAEEEKLMKKKTDTHNIKVHTDYELLTSFFFLVFGFNRPDDSICNRQYRNRSKKLNINLRCGVGRSADQQENVLLKIIYI